MHTVQESTSAGPAPGLLPTLALGLLLGISAPLATQAKGAGIVGSPHDFSTVSWNVSREVCKVCHVPHDHDSAYRRGAVGLLWNHALSSASYTMYSSPTMDGTQDSQPTGTTKMCLGCHDGTVGLDAFSQNPNEPPGGTTYTFVQDYAPGLRTPGGNYWNTGGTVGDLASMHPISVLYDEVADTGLAPKTSSMGASGTIADILEGGKVQCSSCHDVHDGAGESVPGTALLRVAQTTGQGGVASGLCLTCHLK